MSSFDYDTSSPDGRSFGIEYDGKTHHVETRSTGVGDEPYGVLATRDVTEERETARELERQNERLDLLVSRISHDLRNPLSIAVAALEQYRERLTDPKSRAGPRREFPRAKNFLPPRPRRGMTDIDAEIVLFDGFDELDAIGPYEVFENGARAGADLETRLVTLEPTDVVTASHDLRVEPDGVLGDPDLLVVPGGGWTTDDGGVRRVVEDGDLSEEVAARHEEGTTVASVCTGAMVLAEAGILEGRPAITHRGAVDDLAAYADVTDARVVDDGTVVTAGGVTSGIDLALWILEREFDENVAGRVAREMEHERRGEVHR